MSFPAAGTILPPALDAVSMPMTYQLALIPAPTIKVITSDEFDEGQG